MIPDRNFEVHTARFALRTKPDGGVVPQLLVTVLQSLEVPADASDPHGPKMIFEGGSSIVADLRRKVIKYCIRKNLKSRSRLAQQQGLRHGAPDQCPRHLRQYRSRSPGARAFRASASRT